MLSATGASQYSQVTDSIYFYDPVLYPDPGFNCPCDSMPVFPGGPDSLLAFVKSYLTYPQDLVNEEVEGRMIIKFSVDENGKAGEPVIIRSIHPDVNKQCLEMVNKLPRFKPAAVLTSSGKGWFWNPVKTWFSIPVYFTTSYRNPYNISLVITPW